MAANAKINSHRKPVTKNCITDAMTTIFPKTQRGGREWARMDAHTAQARTRAKFIL